MSAARNLLFLAHRLPYPPNKGDKVRSYHLLKHLAQRYRVFVGTFIDDEADERHVDVLRALCADLHVARLAPSIARMRGLRALPRGEAISLPYYRDEGLLRWVRATVAGSGIDTAVVFSSAMAQYVNDLPVRRFVDFVDVDSAKWTQYAPTRPWPLSWLYRREGRTLLAFERETARCSERSFFVTDAEAAMFRAMAPECAGRTEVLSNGVDTTYFAPSTSLRSPFSAAETAVVFTGAMDYWPNVDAVTWFATDVLPALRAQRPALRFYIVGMRPTSAVRALASDAVTVTGAVDDVRPYLQHAAAVVAPLRIARGIQNKVLEAMAMARPVVASQACAGAVPAVAGREFAVAATASEFVDRVDALLRDRTAADAMGRAARDCVVRGFSWDANLAHLDKCIDARVDDVAEVA